MDTLDLFLKYIVVPVGAFVWMIHTKMQNHHTDIEVLKAQAAATKEAHDREFKEVRDNFKRVFEKLDGIEEALRK
jgi:soluble cytochrome b562